MIEKGVKSDNLSIPCFRQMFTVADYWDPSNLGHSTDYGDVISLHNLSHGDTCSQSISDIAVKCEPLKSDPMSWISWVFVRRGAFGDANKW